MKKIDEKYSIDKEGNVYDRINKTRLKKGMSSTGYVTVCIHRKVVKLHKLLAIHFIDNLEGKPIINHIDGDKLNNSISNLEWCTYSENLKHAYDNFLRTPTTGKSRGVNHGQSKFTESDILKIRELNKTLSQKELSAIYNCNPSIIQRIVTNKTYTNIPL